MKTKLKKKRFSSAQIIQDITKAVSPELQRIHDLDKQQLIKLIADAENLSGTNCWWLEYRLARLIISEAKEALELIPTQPRP